MKRATVRRRGKTAFICLPKVEDTDRKRGNRSHRKVNNNNHNNSLLFSQRLFGAAFSSVREWTERVEPHPLRVPFFLPPPVSTIAARLSTFSIPGRHLTLFPIPFARNIHWRLRYRLCAPRRSRKSRMNRTSSSRALFPFEPSHVPRKTRTTSHTCIA